MNDYLGQLAASALTWAQANPLSVMMTAWVMGFIVKRSTWVADPLYCISRWLSKRDNFVAQLLVLPAFVIDTALFCSLVSPMAGVRPKGRQDAESIAKELEDERNQRKRLESRVQSQEQRFVRLLRDLGNKA